ncbi:MAG: DUF362 domain-containing protein [Promethearchaeota archaeon]
MAAAKEKKARVALVKVEDDAEDVARGVREALAAVDADRLLDGKRRVLIKPNILTNQPPERGVTTDPRVLGAIIDWLLEKGVQPEDVFVGESSGGMGRDHTHKAFQASQIAALCEEKGVRWAPFESTELERVDLPNGAVLDHVHLSKEILAADLIINVPKLKTHGQMVLTLCIKNMFGTMVKSVKPRMHSRFPDSLDFAKALVDIFTASSPQLNVVDAVIAMEGNGPGRSGTPVLLNAVLAGTDPVAVDSVCSALAGVEPDLVYTTAEAARRGLGTMDLDEIEVVGARVEDVAKKFKIPGAHKLQRKLMAWFKGPVSFLMRKFAAPKWSVDADKCDRDAVCVRSCPTKALRLPREGPPAWSKEKCIGCACCMELCPQGAILVEIAGVKGIAPYVLPLLAAGVALLVGFGYFLAWLI